MRRIVAIVAFCLAGCASRGGCPSERTCGAAAWVDPSSGGTVDGRMVFAPLVDVVSSRRSALGAEALSVSSDGVWMRFDLSSLAGADGVERAVLSLSPHPSWHPAQGAPRLIVRPAAGVQQASAVSADDAFAAEVTLPSGVRGPVRVDITAMVRQWLDGALPAGTVSVEHSHGTAVFMGSGALSMAARPRLEVVLR